MDVNYKRVNDTDGELTLRFSDYKELTRFLEVTKCRNFVLTIKETIVPAVDERVERRTFPKAGERYGTLYLTQKNTNHYLLEVLKSLKQMEIA